MQEDTQVTVVDPQLEIAEEGAFNKDDPKALINLLPQSMVNALEATQNFFLQDLSDESIRKNIHHMKEYPLLQKLRQSFWIEYQRVMDHGKNRMEMTRVWQGITNKSGDFYNIMKRPEFAAYIFTQPVTMEVKNHIIEDLGWQRMMEIMSVSAVRKARDKQGNVIMEDGKAVELVDPYVAKVQMEIWKQADERKQGGVVKRVAVTSEQKSLNVNVNQDSITHTHQIAPNEFKRMEDIQKRIEELRAKVSPSTIETTSITIDLDEETEN